MTDPMLSRRTGLALAAGALAAPFAAVPGAAQAAAPRTSFDPPGTHRWRTIPYSYDLSRSPYTIGYSGTYPISKNLSTDPRSGAVLDGKTVRVRINGAFAPQPVSTSWWLLPQIWSYRIDRDPRRRELIEATAQNMYNLSWLDPKTKASWFRHTSLYRGGELEQGMPWYSGMSQGMALSVYCTLWEATGTRYWYNLAVQTYRSYRHYRNVRAPQSTPWFIGYEPGWHGTMGTYFEEYPSRNPAKCTHVVNGFMYSMWGLLDYYRITRDAEAKVLLDRGFATLREDFARYRVPGAPSYYAISPYGKRSYGRPSSYHYGVGKMLQTTGRLTRDATFTAQGSALLRDWRP